MGAGDAGREKNALSATPAASSGVEGRSQQGGVWVHTGVGSCAACLLASRRCASEDAIRFVFCDFIIGLVGFDARLNFVRGVKRI